MTVPDAEPPLLPSTACQGPSERAPKHDADGARAVRQPNWTARIVIGMLSIGAIVVGFIGYYGYSSRHKRIDARDRLTRLVDEQVRIAADKAEEYDFGGAKDVLLAAATEVEESPYAEAYLTDDLNRKLDAARFDLQQRDADHRDKIRTGWTVIDGRLVSPAEQQRALAEEKRREDEERQKREKEARLAEIRRKAEEDRRFAEEQRVLAERKAAEERARRNAAENGLRRSEKETAQRKAKFTRYLETVMEWRDKQFDKLSDDALLPYLELLYFGTEGLRFSCLHQLEVGRLGFFDSVKIMQVVDGSTVLVSYEFKCLKRVGASIIQTTEDVKTLMIKGFNTTPFVDGENLNLSGQIMEIAGPVSYTTVLGAKKKVFVATPFDLSDLDKYATEFTDPDLWMKQLKDLRRGGDE